MKLTSLLIILLMSSTLIAQPEDSLLIKKRHIYGYELKIGYLAARNTWTQTDADISSGGYTSTGVSIDQTHQLGHGVSTEFELRLKHFGFSAGINLLEWDESFVGKKGVTYHHPKAPQGYPLIAHYYKSTSEYDATALELRAKVGIEYWVFSARRPYNFGVSLSYNPRLYTAQKKFIGSELNITTFTKLGLGCQVPVLRKKMLEAMTIRLLQKMG